MSEITEGNILFMNEGRAVLTGFNFMLRVEAAFDMPLKAVRAFTRELEFDYIQEGGLNDYVHMRRKGITKPFTFEFDRYVGINYIDTLPLGANLLLPLILMVSRIPGQFIPLVSARTYTFTGCTVIKKTYGELDGNKSELLVETVTIAYRELVVLDAPWSEAAGGAIDESYKDGQNSSTKTEEDKLRLRCDAVVAEAEKLKKDISEYGTNLEKMLAPDRKWEEEEARIDKENAKREADKKPGEIIVPKTTGEDKADREARLARKPQLDACESAYNDAKKAVDDAHQAGFHARSFTLETGLKDLTEKAEALLPAARGKAVKEKFPALPTI